MSVQVRLKLKTSSAAIVPLMAVMGATQIACANPPSFELPSFERWGSDSSYPQADSSVQYFTAAEQAANRRDISALYNYEEMMRGGLFAMYPAYWRLSSDLSAQSPASIAMYVRQYPDTVMAEKLAADYAEVKAEAGDYAAVRQVANLITNPDTSEQCALALGFNHAGDSMRALMQKPLVWTTTLRQPELCNQLAMELNNNPLISRDDRIQRLRLMIRTGKTGDIMMLSSSLGIAIDYAALSEIQLNPNAFLLRFASLPPSERNQYLYLYAISRLSAKSYREAAIQLEYDIRADDQRSQPLIDADTRRYAYRILGVRRMNHNTDDGFNSEAVDWFNKSLGLPFNFEESEDYAQSAIRFSRWDELQTAIASLNGETQKQPIWQYWLARAYEQSSDAGKRNQAKQIYAQLAQGNDYYGLMAKDKVGQRFNMASMGGRDMPTVSTHDRSRMLQDAHFARAFALYQSDASRSYANREWNWAVKKARDNRDDDLIIAAARHAHDIGWLDRAIYAIDNSDRIDSLALSHPMPHQSSVVNHSRAVGIDPAWAYGIMRQESRFVTTARSGVGASGLMQIMPDTARFIARNLGETYSASRANSGDTNIRYGTWYMSYVMNKVGGQPVMATAGYNAGPNNALRWQPVYGSLAADQYIESIAYPETREYVKHVMENATVYGALLGNPQSISSRMGIVSAQF